MTGLQDVTELMLAADPQHISADVYVDTYCTVYSFLIVFYIAYFILLTFAFHMSCSSAISSRWLLHLLVGETVSITQ